MKPTVGFALCGSFCTFRKAIDALRALTAQYTVVPIFSDAAWETDTRFGASADFRAEVTALCGTEPLHTLAQVEPLGPKRLLDLLIVALKYGALPGALDSIRTIVSERTVVMSLMNGVDSEELIAAQIGAAHVLPALIKVASHRTEDGVRFDPKTTIGIIYGELTAPFDSDRVQAVRALFADTGIHFRVTEHIREEIWSKFRLNVCNNLPQAILGAGVGCYSDSAHIKAISDGLRRELEAIAAAKGIDLSKAAAGSTHGSTVPPTARYSTLQDLDAGRHTEIDMFSGALMRMGRELGIPMPYNEYTYHMIKALEEKNDGLFDYTATDAVTFSR